MEALNRLIGLKSAIALVIGGVIGSGIFMKPAFIAYSMPHPSLVISVWIVAGVVTLFGSMSNAEVATMYPETGGQYVFFQKMYGDRFAFLYGWASFSVFNTAGNASIAFVLAQYIDYFYMLPIFTDDIVQSSAIHVPMIGTFYLLKDIGVKAVTIFVLALLTWINYRSVSISTSLQRALTLLKFLAIIGLTLGFLSSRGGSMGHFEMSTDNNMTTWEWIGAYVSCLSAVFWAYDGWNNITFVAGEIENPQQNIPKSLIIGIVSCIVIYTMFNIALIYVAPISTISSSTSVAADLARIAFGPMGGSIIAAMIILSVVGTVNANVMSTARVTYAMGQGSRIFKSTYHTHPTYKTPDRALMWNLIWSMMLVLSGSFDLLTDMLIFVSWFFYGASAVGLFVLRRKMPDHVRPFKVPGYPVVPAIFIVFVVGFLLLTLIHDIEQYSSGKTEVINSLLGILVVSIGVVLYRKK
jgi:basic amino acid/polyamine antiporter, APA family